MKCLAFLLLLLATVAAAHAQPFVDNARVVDVEPQYDSVRVPRQDCRSDWVSEAQRSDRRDVGGAVLGGLVGGLLGNQVGGGHGREAATAIGAVVGAFTGSDIASRERYAQPVPTAREVTSCRTAYDVQSRLVGYRVTYDYHGQQGTVLMAEAPGRYVPVRVAVDPVGR